MDRIDEAYNGLMGEEFMRKTRERMHWICSQVDGLKVLDVGCSQGTLARLLGSVGKEVCAIDINKDAIAYAEEKLAQSDGTARDRISFRAVSFLDFESEERFDTVVMGEILEHLAVPVEFVKKAHYHLSTGGTFVVTVPFGINDDPDHRQTFYWSWIFETLAPYFEIKEVKFFGKWIGVVAVRREQKAEVEKTVSLAAVKELEAAFYSIERPLVNENKLRGERIRTQQKANEAKLIKFSQEVDQLKAALGERRGEDVARAEKIGYLSALFEQTKVALEAEKKKSAEAMAALAAANDSLAAAKKKAAEEDAQLKSKITQLTSQNRELSNQKRQVERALNIEKKAHDKLAKSKLGRLTLKYWKWKDRRKGLQNLPQKSEQSTANQIKGSSSGNHQQKIVSVADELPKGDETFFERCKKKLAGMPESNGCRYYEKINAKIGIICDQFYYDSIFSSADFIYISPDASETQLAALDCMLVVSAWRGLKDDEWKGISTEGRPRRIAAEKIIEICRKNNVPTVFYSKEDPPNYDLYVGLAQRCDYVFTSAAECVPDYKRDCGHDRVYVMEFCINPEMHNPVGMRHAKKERNVIFSGSWMEKYPHRCHDLGIIFEGILKSGRELNIVDRNYALRGNPMYRYPEKYRKYQSPAIDHADLLKVHKLFDWAVNINTVKDSSTMFANRVYELQAAGNLLLSNYSVGVSNLLPTVFLVHDSEEAARMLSAFTDDELYERQISGVRRVMTGETCYDRVGRMLDTIGVRKIKSFNRRVMVVADKITDRIRTMFDRQSLAEKELFAISDVTEALYEQADIVAFFQEDADYGVFYLEDMVNAFKYTDCDYITKEAFSRRGKHVKGREHCYVDRISSKYRTVFWRDSFEWKTLKEMHGEKKRVNGYSTDRFNYTEGAVHRKTVKPDVSVIMPTYNNGWFLYGRSFASLRRSSLFDKMEIIIVDDGSSDGFTPKMGEHLESIYPNVSAHSCSTETASGSAARPRNVGMRLANGKYIVFLDPDDEEIGDGIFELYKHAAEKPEVDVVCGSLIKYEGDGSVIDKIKEKVSKEILRQDHDPLHALLVSKFMPWNTMSMLIRRGCILDNDIFQVEGGLGEDSLFSQQLMSSAKCVLYAPIIMLLYYAERKDSVTHHIDIGFFESHLLTEKSRIGWLEKANLLEEYIGRRIVQYVTGWYFKKLGLVAPERREICCRKVREIISLYGSGNPGGNSKIGAFIAAVDKGDVSSLFGTIIPLPKETSVGVRVEILPVQPKFQLPKTKTFVWHKCNLDGVEKVFIVGSVEGAGISADIEKSSLMSIVFKDGDQKVLKTGKLSCSPKFGEYTYLTAGAGKARKFRLPVQVPSGAKTLSLGFMRWASTGVISISDVSVMGTLRN